MARKLFKDEYEYGGLVKEFYIDQFGNPFVMESRFEMMFHGWGDHTGTPGRLIETREYMISFSELREAARRAKESAFQDIDETNWEEVVRAATQGRKRKRRRATEA